MEVTLGKMKGARGYVFTVSVQKTPIAGLTISATRGSETFSDRPTRFEGKKWCSEIEQDAIEICETVKNAFISIDE